MRRAFEAARLTLLGSFAVDVEVSPVRGPKRARLRGVLGDTGSEFSWIPAETLRRIGIAVFKKDQAFVMANGQTKPRDVGIAILHQNGFMTVDEVVFAKPGDLTLLGARTLEGFNAHVDHVRRRLVAAGPIPAASS